MHFEEVLCTIGTQHALAFRIRCCVIRCNWIFGGISTAKETKYAKKGQQSAQMLCFGTVLEKLLCACRRCEIKDSAFGNHRTFLDGDFLSCIWRVSRLSCHLHLQQGDPNEDTARHRSKWSHRDIHVSGWFATPPASVRVAKRSGDGNVAMRSIKICRTARHQPGRQFNLVIGRIVMRLQKIVANSLPRSWLRCARATPQWITIAHWPVGTPRVASR